LTQRAANRLGERCDVDAHFALVDRALLVVVLELNRVFDRDDVVVVVIVEIVNHRGQRGRFARPRGSGDDNQAARPRDEALKYRGYAEIVHRPQLDRNLPQHHGDVTALAENRHAETGRVAKGEAEVGAARLLKLLLAAVRRDALHESLRIGRLEHLGFQSLHPPVNAQDRRLAHRDVKIARTLLHAGREQFVDKNRSHSPIIPLRKRTGRQSAGLEPRSNSTLTPAADNRRNVRPAQLPCRPCGLPVAIAREASSLWLSRLLRFAPLPRTKEGSSSSPAAWIAAGAEWHSRRGHQAPAPAGCRTLSEYGEQSIIRRLKHKLKAFLLYIPRSRDFRASDGCVGEAFR
jgi:hypothetical protein